MFWICPFVSPDSPEFRELQQKGYLIKKKGTNAAAIIPWWNGYSACYDLSNPAAAEHLKKQLRDMQEKYGADGFKFDAGDIGHYNDPELEFYDKSATSVDCASTGRRSDWISVQRISRRMENGRRGIGATPG